MGLGQNGGGEDKATISQHDRIKYILLLQDIVIFNRKIPTTKPNITTLYQAILKKICN